MRQFETVAEAEAIADDGNTVKKGLNAVISSFSSLKNFLYFSLNRIWGAINS